MNGTEDHNHNCIECGVQCTCGHEKCELCVDCFWDLVLKDEDKPVLAEDLEFGPKRKGAQYGGREDV